MRCICMHVSILGYAVSSLAMVCITRNVNVTVYDLARNGYVRSLHAAELPLKELN